MSQSDPSVQVKDKSLEEKKINGNLLIIGFVLGLYFLNSNKLGNTNELLNMRNILMVGGVMYFKFLKNNKYNKYNKYLYISVILFLLAKLKNCKKHVIVHQVLHFIK